MLFADTSAIFAFLVADGRNHRAWELAREWPDQDFSLTDRQSFAIIERSRQLRAWSYDADFAVIRLGRQRRMSLDLVQ